MYYLISPFCYTYIYMYIFSLDLLQLPQYICLGVWGLLKFTEGVTPTGVTLMPVYSRDFNHTNFILANY